MRHGRGGSGSVSDRPHHRRNVSASTQNQALAAILLSYRDVLAIELPWLEGVIRVRQLLIMERDKVKVLTMID